MISYSTFLLALVPGCYIHLLHEFAKAARSHAGSVGEPCMSEMTLKRLTGKYWSILLSLGFCLFVAGGNYYKMEATSTISHWIPWTICLAVFLLSMLAPVTTSPVHPIARSLAYEYLFIRLCYLIAYEMFFRGLVYGLSLQYMSVTAAVAVNVALYAGAHFYSSQKEIIACIPLGLLFCWLRSEYDSILFPVLMHCCMAIPFEFRVLTSSIQINKTPHHEDHVNWRNRLSRSCHRVRSGL